MFTDEQSKIDTIFSKVDNEKVRTLLYQVLINFEIYKDTVMKINENMEQLNFNNFAKTQTCNMADGIFSSQKYKEYQLLYTLKVIGNLITLITSAHRIITCIKSCRNLEKNEDWKELRETIKRCDDKYQNKLRNYMEHLDEKVSKQELDNNNCYFTPERILNCIDDSNNLVFDFNDDALQLIYALIESVFDMLYKRASKVY